MVVLVISMPEPARPKDVEARRSAFRAWIDRLKNEKKVRSFYPRVGRGAVVIFDVLSHEELHELLTQWLEIVPVRHAIYPLLEP